jgi:hypothetical protein
MEYIHNTTNEVSSKRAIVDSIKAHTSLGPNTLAEMGWTPVLAAPKPAPSSDVKTVRKTAPVQDALGNWVEGYTEFDMFSTDEDGTKAEKEEAYLAEKAEKEALAESDALKVSGVEILGVMCSATGKDQNGMIAIGLDKMKCDASATPFEPTLMTFENGSELWITADNFDVVEAAWRSFRRSFFSA